MRQLRLECKHFSILNVHFEKMASTISGQFQPEALIKLSAFVHLYCFQWAFYWYLFDVCTKLQHGETVAVKWPMTCTHTY